jgi:transcriptional regulator with XRE-family HTH domain
MLTESELVEMSSDDYGPVVANALLIKDLRARRHGRGEKQEAVAKALEWSKSKFMRVELGTVRVTRADLELLLRHYEVDDDAVVARLISLARAARAPAWWDKHNIGDKAYQAYIGYEAGASTIKMSQGLLVPGILQAPSYARVVAATYVPADQIDGLVSLRIERQENIFDEENPPQQYHILDEAVIRRRVGNAMPEQLRYLIELSQRPEVDIRVIPFKVGPHFGMRGPFALLGFDVDLDDVLYLESARRGDLLIAGPDDGETVSGSPGGGASAKLDEIVEYQEGFDTLQKLALEPDASRELLDRAAKEMSL